MEMLYLTLSPHHAGRDVFFIFFFAAALFHAHPLWKQPGEKTLAKASLIVLTDNGDAVPWGQWLPWAHCPF
jgi:hypothetical protein